VKHDSAQNVTRSSTPHCLILAFAQVLGGLLGYVEGGACTEVCWQLADEFQNFATVLK